MIPSGTIILAAAAWLAWALVCRWILQNPREDALTGLFYRATQAYAHLLHRIEVVGGEHIPPERYPGALIVVANHTAGVDPLLVQISCPFEIRWLMGRDMRHPAIEDFWKFASIIEVNRHGRDTTAAREAMRYLNAGGVIGVFPEGRLERPRRRFLPFQAGIGLLVARSGAPVLPVWIDGTPDAPTAWASLLKSSNARLTFGPLMQFGGRGLSPQQITDEIRAWFERTSGWPGSRS